MSSLEDEVHEMVLLSHADYSRIKKNSDLYLSQSKNKCDCESKEKKDSVAVGEQQGHGETTSYDNDDIPKGETSYDVNTDIPKEIPIQLAQPNNVFEEIELNHKLLSLLPGIKKEKGKALLKELQKKKNMSWSIDHEVVLNDKIISGSDLRKLLDIVFTGVRRNKIIGETDFINFLTNENLGHYVESVSPNWYFIGKP